MQVLGVLLLHAFCTPPARILYSSCTPPALLLHSYCTHTARILHAYCTHTALLLHAYCTPTVLLLHSSCTPTVLLLLSYFTPTTVLVLYSYCSPTLRQRLYSYCTPTSLLLYAYDCTPTVLLLQRLWQWAASATNRSSTKTRFASSVARRPSSGEMMRVTRVVLCGIVFSRFYNRMRYNRMRVSLLSSLTTTLFPRYCGPHYYSLPSLLPSLLLSSPTPLTTAALTTPYIVALVTLAASCTRTSPRGRC
jgi:hypothetical protein